MPTELEQLKGLLEYAPYLTWPIATILVFSILGKYGIIDALASWIKKSPDSKVSKDFYAFKELAEGNHYTDLEDLKEWRIATDSRINKLAEDVAFIKGKLNGHL
ncbi:MAG: UPF0767 family protein [Podoviridae sp. ctviO18]|nr:MAG: UPF0767 family protein [Podoviridae sp. ctviO18]